MKTPLLLISAILLAQSTPIQDAQVAVSMVSASLQRAQAERDAMQTELNVRQATIDALKAQLAAPTQADADLNAVCPNCKNDIAAIVAAAKAEGRTFDLAILLKWEVAPKPGSSAVKQ